MRKVTVWRSTPSSSAAWMAAAAWSTIAPGERGSWLAAPLADAGAAADAAAAAPLLPAAMAGRRWREGAPKGRAWGALLTPGALLPAAAAAGCRPAGRQGLLAAADGLWVPVLFIRGADTRAADIAVDMLG